MIVGHPFYYSPSGKGILIFPENARPGLLLSIFNFNVLYCKLIQLSNHWHSRLLTISSPTFHPSVSLMSTTTGSNIGEGIEKGQSFKSQVTIVQAYVHAESAARLAPFGYRLLFFCASFRGQVREGVFIS